MEIGRFCLVAGLQFVDLDSTYGVVGEAKPVTEIAMAGDRTRFLSEGFDDHVAKPIEPTRLAEALT